jgi:glycosyltransferase involved in cell wall biosynthesis
MKTQMVIISPTAANIESLKHAGLLRRQIWLLTEYSKQFHVKYYSSDYKNYSNILGIHHCCLPCKIKIFGLRHLAFYLFLIYQARNMKGIIRILGPGLPVLPIIKWLSKGEIVTNFNYDWATVTRANYEGIKKYSAKMVQATALKVSDLVICTTESLKQKCEEKYNRNVAVIPNFVDNTIFCESKHKTNRVIYAGRLHWAKGIVFLLEAFKKLKIEINELELIICGEGEYKKDILKWLDSNRVKDVKLFGAIPQDDLARLVASSKIFVLPTITLEGHPKALIEALTCGTACVVSDVPGNLDIIKHRENGLVCKAKNSNSLYRAIKELLINDLLRKSIEKKAKTFSVRYHPENTIQRELSIIEGILNE